MSKSTLKKELKTLDEDQLRELILDVYEALKPARDYFEFFINPDVEKLTEKYQKIIDKEVNRVKRRTSKARVSVIKNAIKEFKAYGVDVRQVNDLSLRTVKNMLEVFYHNYHTKTQVNCVGDLVSMIMEDADKQGFFSEQLTHVLEVTDNLRCSVSYKNYIRRLLDQPLLVVPPERKWT